MNKLELSGKVLNVKFFENCNLLTLAVEYELNNQGLSDGTEDVFSVFCISEGTQNLSSRLFSGDYVKVDGHLQIDKKWNAEKTKLKKTLHIHADEIKKE